MHRRLPALALALLAVLFAPPLQAQLVTFDDLPTPDPVASPLPSPYAGFGWTNMFYVDPDVFLPIDPTGVGYVNVRRSGPYVGLIGFGQAGSVTSAADFTFNGGWFARAFSTESQQLQLRGFNASSVEVFSLLVDISSITPTLVDVNWTGLRELRIEPTITGAKQQIAFDNLRLNGAIDPTIVPEPSTYALLGSGLVGLALAARRRRTR